jgi:PAS domain S-box-containing protein
MIRLRRVSKASAAVTAAVGSITAIGWVADLPALVVPPSGTAMRLDASLEAILAGAALWSLADTDAGRRRRWLGLGLAALATLLAGATLLHYGSPLDLGLHRLFGHQPAAGRPPTTAFGFFLVGAALLTLDARTRSGFRPADLLAVTAFLVGLVAMTDILYRVGLPPGGELHQRMSPFAALCLLVLPVGLLLARPRAGLMGVMTEDAVGGALARRLLPFILLVPPGLGWLRLAGQQAGLYDSEFGAALMVPTTVVLLGAVTLWTAASLNRAERTRRLLEGERERMDEQLRRTNQLLDAVVEHLPLMIFMKEAEQLRFVRFNRAGEELLGLSRADLLGKNDHDLFPTDQARHFQAKDRETLAGRLVVDVEEPIDSPAGRRWLRTKKVTLTADDGKPAFLLGISEDITLRRLKDQELRKWAHVFQHAHFGIALASADGRTLEAMNAAFARMHGYDVDELIGRPVLDLIAPGEEAAALRVIDRADQSAAQSFQILCRRKDGSTFPALVNVSTFQDADGNALFRAANVQDITGIKETEEELRRAKNAAEANSRELESFSYSVSHDLRSPLRSIDGFSQALLEDHGDRLDEDARHHLARVRGAAQRMAQLIDDLLDLSRVTRAELDRRSVDLSAVAGEVAGELARREPTRTVRFTIADGLHTMGDPRLCRVLLENLLGNAWKFTARRESAHIEVGQAAEDGQPHFFVRDDGAGFDMAYAGKLFGAFQRLHRESEFEGTGIGLATVQRIVTRHGGRIWAEGRVGGGATFRFTLRP